MRCTKIPGRCTSSGIDLARFDELLDFGDRNLAGHRAERIEVTRRLVKDQVAGAIADRRAHQREVADDAGFEHVLAAVETRVSFFGDAIATLPSASCRHGRPPSATSVPSPAGV